MKYPGFYARLKISCWFFSLYEGNVPHDAILYGLDWLVDISISGALGLSYSTLRPNLIIFFYWLACNLHPSMISGTCNNHFANNVHHIYLAVFFFYFNVSFNYTLKILQETITHTTLSCYLSKNHKIQVNETNSKKLNSPIIFLTILDSTYIAFTLIYF